MQRLLKKPSKDSIGDKMRTGSAKLAQGNTFLSFISTNTNHDNKTIKIFLLNVDRVYFTKLTSLGGYDKEQRQDHYY